MIKAIFFDLFFTLINPKYSRENEYDVLGISAAEWEKYAEDDVLYEERARGRVKSEKEIIDKIVRMMPYDLKDEQKQIILHRREERMKRALLEIDNKILACLRQLHKSNIKIGLISNADVIDTKYWYESPLAEFFDSVIFSCNIGMLKPEMGIYDVAMKRLHVLPEESVFVGDGGSNEMYGAKMAGMRTIFTEYLESKANSQKEQIMKYADYHVKNFDDILKYSC
ncbi:haloacid dehalogenase [Anaerocolumna cellulosilytica]|uniref:Haloacid dehalogenase n=1 Tax=Anaerocolumna cellulosilytica TaxID=433286 RepID=A0A6S6R316_9FIRM|nr:HAD-IA family hydrolase [Anaerocolumna cellulosilytica]MBB5196421.1 putative hydrolase of the HAD superfamily [Anaerocolumna cellulosilytica]BCJ94457.1 haloacid dehalogenase [Anaerocolumna cellulosilytica]